MEHIIVIVRGMASNTALAKTNIPCNEGDLGPQTQFHFEKSKFPPQNSRDSTYT